MMYEDLPGPWLDAQRAAFDGDTELPGLGFTHDEFLYERILLDISRTREYMPPEAPAAEPYDGDPQAYLRAVCQAAQTAAGGVERPGQFNLGRYKNFRINNLSTDVASHVFAWLEDNHFAIKALWGKTFGPGDFNRVLLPYFVRTVALATAGPRDIAQCAFRQQRNALTDELEIQGANYYRRAASGELRAKIVETQQQLVQIPYEMPVADYARMTPEQQREIIDAIGKEALAFWKHAVVYCLPVDMYGSLSLLLRPVSELEEILARDPDPEEVVWHYVREGFSSESRAEIERRLAEARSGVAIAQATQEGTASLPVILRNAQLGDTLQLTETDRSVRRVELERLVGQVNEALVALVTAGLPAAYRWNWEAAGGDAVAKLLGKHAGNILDVQMQRLAIDEAGLKKLFPEGRTYIDPERFYRYLLTAKLKSSAGPPISTSIDCGVYIRSAKKNGIPQICRYAGNRASGDKALALLHEASSQMARATGAISLINSLRG